MRYKQERTNRSLNSSYFSGGWDFSQASSYGGYSRRSTASSLRSNGRTMSKKQRNFIVILGLTSLVSISIYNSFGSTTPNKLDPQSMVVLPQSLNVVDNNHKNSFRQRENIEEVHPLDGDRIHLPQFDMGEENPKNHPDDESIQSRVVPNNRIREESSKPSSSMLSSEKSNDKNGRYTTIVGYKPNDKKVDSSYEQSVVSNMHNEHKSEQLPQKQQKQKDQSRKGTHSSRIIQAKELIEKQRREKEEPKEDKKMIEKMMSILNRQHDEGQQREKSNEKNLLASSKKIQTNELALLDRYLVEPYKPEIDAFRKMTNNEWCKPSLLPPLDYDNCNKPAPFYKVPFRGSNIAQAFQYILLNAIKALEDQSACLYLHVDEEHSSFPRNFWGTLVQPIGIRIDSAIIKNSTTLSWDQLSEDMALEPYDKYTTSTIPFLHLEDIPRNDLKRTLLRRLWRPAKSIRHKACNRLDELMDHEEDYIAISLHHGGNKQHLKAELYIEKVEQAVKEHFDAGKIPMIFFATDQDCSLLDELRKLKPSWRMVSESCSPPKTVWLTGYEKFFVELFAMAGAKALVGVSTSAVSWWVYFMREKTDKETFYFLDKSEEMNQESASEFTDSNVVVDEVDNFKTNNEWCLPPKEPPMDYDNCNKEAVLYNIPFVGTNLAQAFQFILLGAIMALEDQNACLYLDESQSVLEKLMQPIGLKSIKAATGQKETTVKWEQVLDDIDLRPNKNILSHIPALKMENITRNELKRIVLRRLWRPTKEIRQKTCTLLDTLLEKDKEYIAISLHPNDEQEHVVISHYIDKVEHMVKKNFSGRTPLIYVATNQDCGLLEKLRNQKPLWPTVSECDLPEQTLKGLTGYEKFFVELFAMAGAKVWIGVADSTVSWWVYFMRQKAEKETFGSQLATWY